MQTGEHWYAMQDPEGTPQGYARIRVDDRDDGTQRYRWELHLAFPGGTYEEERSARFDAAGCMQEATYEDAQSAVHATREGNRLVGTHRHPEGETAIDLEVDETAVAGMGFVLVTTLPLEEGYVRTLSDFNEAQGFKPDGELRLVVGGEEKLSLPEGDVSSRRVTLHRADGRELPMWVDGSGRLLQADWGGGNLMILHPTSTAHLFQPKPPPVAILDLEDHSRLVVGGTFEGVAPAEMFRWWTEADRLVQWWPEAATVGDAVDGDYVLTWPQANYKLLGRILAWEPPGRFAFSWQWEHMPELPEQRVDVTFEPAEGGTKVEIVHGPYRDTEEDQKGREGHWQGWKTMAGRLQAAIASRGS